MSLISNLVVTREQPEQKTLKISGRAPTERELQTRGPLWVVVLTRYLITAMIAASVILTVLCSTVVVASVAAWSMLY